jgi:hypothetical protein
VGALVVGLICLAAGSTNLTVTGCPVEDSKCMLCLCLHNRRINPSFLVGKHLHGDHGDLYQQKETKV